MKFKVFIPLMLLVLIVLEAQAQYSQKRCRWITVSTDEVVLDSMTVEPGSLQFSEPLDYFYDVSTGKISFSELSADSVEVCYLFFPFSLHNRTYNRSLDEYDSSIIIDNHQKFDGGYYQKEELFRTEEISKTGSISRGISFGNNQSVFVNSSLNLQMEGKLSDDVNIRAIISDQNIPFQPEGNTQQLQEFDRVFIELYNDNTQLIVGDIVLKNPESYFQRYYKNVQGAHFNTRYNTGNSTGESSVSLSLGKGKFASVILEPLEGVSGPYKLRGPNNERFITVLANSERVFIDGRQIKRGFNLDYIIDYNLGEITFNSNVMITKFTRIRVDYEYSEQNYNRTILQAGHIQEWKKLKVYINAYSEKDNKNNPLTFDLNQENQQIFNDLGDSLAQALVSAVDSISFNENEILYKQMDTVALDGSPVSGILVRSTNPENAFYRASFSQIKNGNYTLLNSTANGRVYEWVSPVNGVPQGEYEPVRIIPLPLKRNMVVAGLEYKISEKEKIFGELAYSDQDVNLYSDKDSEDNKGFAVKLGYQVEDKELNFFNNYRLNAQVDYEFDNKNFKPIDRFRYIEFDRDWSNNTPSNTELVEDHIFNAAIGLKKDLYNQFSYKLSSRQRENQVEGSQHTLDFRKSLGNFYLNADLFLMNNQTAFSSSDWNRLSLEAFYNTGFVVPGYRFVQDQNEVINNDSLSTAMNFTAHEFYLRSSDSLKTRFRVDYTYREDNAPVQNELVLNNISRTTNFFLSTMANRNHQVNFNATYRVIENLNNSEEDEKEETIQGRLDWISTFFKRNLRTELSYAVSSGRELKRDFIYLEVPLGEGTHTWRDENGDGIQDLNEFYEALNADERNFAKIFLPTDEFIDAFATIFNYRINLSAPRSWQKEQGLKKVLGKFSNVTSWSIDRKITSDDIADRLIPFLKVDEEDLLSNREILRSTLFYNRANPKFGGDLSLLDTELKQLLTEGFESRNRKEYKLNLRWNVQKAYNFKILSSRINEQVSSDFLTAKNYRIVGNSIGQEFAWQPKNTFRISALYTYRTKENVLSEDSPENATFNDFVFSARFSKVSKSTLNLNFTYSDIDFTGEENTALGYALLEALQPGDNFRWSVNWQYKLAKGLQMNLNYAGRKSGENSVINIGRVQISALF